MFKFIVQKPKQALGEVFFGKCTVTAAYSAHCQ